MMIRNVLLALLLTLGVAACGGSGEAEEPRLLEQLAQFCERPQPPVVDERVAQPRPVEA